MKPTPAMIGAAHDVTMKESGIILSHELITKIYEAMQAQAANDRRVSYVCPVCAASMIESDTALLRQALEALELRCGTNAEERNELIPALRERLGEGA